MIKLRDINWEFIGVWTAAAGFMFIVMLLIVSLISSLILGDVSFLQSTALLLPELVLALLIILIGAAMSAATAIYDRFKKGGEHGKE